jgi:hypothetical protein
LSGFKAVEVDAASRRRTGREFVLSATTRDGAITELLAHLGVPADHARVDPSRTLIELNEALWTIVAAPRSEANELGLRRAGAKHKRVR